MIFRLWSVNDCWFIMSNYLSTDSWLYEWILNWISWGEIFNKVWCVSSHDAWRSKLLPFIVMPRKLWNFFERKKINRTSEMWNDFVADNLEIRGLKGMQLCLVKIFFVGTLSISFSLAYAWDHDLLSSFIHNPI